MKTDNNKLQALRREIDAIDDSLHDLIMERTKIVEKVRTVKSKDKIKIRPAREAEILYRLMARHSGEFPKQELARIWRELIVATLRFEGPFSVAVAAPEGEPGFWDLARDQYGSFAPMRRHVSSRGVVEAVGNGDATVGILPLPRHDDTNHWWRLLVSGVPETPKIIARLPFISGGNSRGTETEALVIGQVAQEETGRDRSFLVVESAEDIGFKAIETALSQTGFSAVFNQVWHDPDRPAAWTYLVEVLGFLRSDGQRFRRLVDSLDKRAIQVIHLGGYATPLSEADLARVEAADAERGVRS